MKSEYYVYWISPRGFANEGDYVYGTPDEITQELGSNRKAESLRQYVESRHKSLATARWGAAKAARKAIREYHAHETVSIGIRAAGKKATQEDFEAVKYNVFPTNA